MPSLSCAAPVRELFEAPCAETCCFVVFLFVLGILLEGLEDVGLDALLVSEDIPAIGDFLIGVFGKMENRSNRDDLVKGDRKVMKGTYHDDLVEGDRLSSFVVAAAVAVAIAIAIAFDFAVAIVLRNDNIDRC